MRRRLVAERIRAGRRAARCAWVTNLVAVATVFASGLPSAFGATAGEARFEQIFSTDGEPAGLHFRAAYGPDADVHADVDADAPSAAVAVRLAHRLEVWRDGDTRIRRLTDDRIDIVATRLEGEAEGGIGFTVVDRLRRTRSVVDRTTLLQLGLFVDWFSQGHAVRRPDGPYRLVKLERPSPEPLPGRRCVWWRLAVEQTGAAATTDVCWSEELKLPILMQDASQRVVWRVLAADVGPVDSAVFVPMVGMRAMPGAGEATGPDND